MKPQDIFKKLKVMFDNPWKAEQEKEVLNSFLDLLSPFDDEQLQHAHSSVMSVWKTQTPPKPAHYLDHLRQQSNVKVSDLKFSTKQKFDEWFTKQPIKVKIMYIEQVRENDLEKMRSAARRADISQETYYQNRIAHADKLLGNLTGKSQQALI